MPVVNDVSLSLEKGEFVGLIGPNGSGKSTLLRLVTHVLVPDKGRTVLAGRDIRTMPRKEFARQVAFVSQDTTINFSYKVREIVLMGRIPHLGQLELETKKDFAIAESALKLTGTLHLKDKEIDSLSAGERQCVIIAKALAQEPSLLFLDEPTSHLDIGHQIKILDLLKKLNQENNLTIAIVLHDLNLASEYCDRLVLLDKGTIVTQGAPEAVLTYPNIETVYNTVVVVDKNRVSGKPNVVLVAGSQLCRQK